MQRESLTTAPRCGGRTMKSGRNERCTLRGRTMVSKASSRTEQYDEDPEDGRENVHV